MTLQTCFKAIGFKHYTLENKVLFNVIKRWQCSRCNRMKHLSGWISVNAHQELQIKIKSLVFNNIELTPWDFGNNWCAEALRPHVDQKKTQETICTSCQKAKWLLEVLIMDNNIKETEYTNPSRTEQLHFHQLSLEELNHSGSYIFMFKCINVLVDVFLLWVKAGKKHDAVKK